MKISLCNEVLRDFDFERQCEYAAELGYAGIEVAPFTLSQDPHLIPASVRSGLRQTAEQAGLEITGLHWLLLTPSGLSITDPDVSVRQRTIEVMKGLVELCSDLGGKVLVHGSPKQRNIDPDDDWSEAENRAVQAFEAVAPVAEAAGVVYCVEPLTQKETNFINTLEEAAGLVDRVASPGFKSMLDVKAALGAEGKTLPELVDEWLPKGLIAHVHLNDVNLRAPGQGQVAFTPLLAALKRNGYEGVLSIEPFDYRPDGTAVAARAIGYIQGVLEGLES